MKKILREEFGEMGCGFKGSEKAMEGERRLDRN